MRRYSLLALVLGIVLVPFGVAAAVSGHRNHVANLERELSSEADEHAGDLDAYFARARSAILLTANQSPFERFIEAPGTRAEKLRAGGIDLAAANHALAYLQHLYPSAIGEACFIDALGREAARVVRGQIAPLGDLSTTERSTSFFAPTFATPPGRVYQARPYVSPDTHEWVVANATVVPSRDGRRHAIVHFEVTVESFRRAFESDEDEYAVYVVDRRTGRVIIDGGHPQRNGAPLGRPADGRFRTLAADTGDRGLADVDGHRAAYDSVDRAAGNANDWIVVARSTEPPPTLLGDLGVIPIGIAALALLLMLFGATGLRAQRQELLSAAETDGLTGLPNRRRLIADLDRRIPRAGEGAAVLMLFDLNGFKDYNDAFGHLAGDALLARLGHALSTALGARGIAYRLGGDEFCVLCGAHDRVAIERDALEALSECGEGFDVTASHGVVALPDEAADTIEALRLADQRMYAAKQGGRATAGRQSKDVLLRALAERHPDLGEHNDGVAELAVAVAERLGLTEDDVARVRLAAELHDVGKVAIPDAILDKPGPLDDEEWAFMRRHTLIGERILAAAPSLLPVGRLVRASHERWDGGGYPDGLAGTAIPLGARIVAVADAFDAMTTNRPYSKARTAAVALAELRRCAGTQFDAEIVALFETVVFERLAPADASLAA